MIHLLDTGTFILLLRGTAIATARGAREKTVKLSAGKILPRCRELAVDCVHHCGIVRSTLESKGKGIAPLDTLVAAHALALGAVLVTHNTREFKRVPRLVVEDWA